MLLKPISIFSQDVRVTAFDEKLFHSHNIHVNAADNSILSRYFADPGKAFVFVINIVRNLWF